MSAAHHGQGAGGSAGPHVATIAYGGHLWDAYLDFADDPRRPSSFRARMRFERAGPDGVQITAETAVIIIEESYQEAVAKARGMDDRQLEALLRSALPDEV
jgi:hypothetical protein